MPKVKTHSASKKRFKVTATGKVKMSNACRRHRLVSKPRKAKNQHKMPTFAASSDAARVKKMLPYV
ncbi:MAG: 50S ribosomal protein L35 [Clostridia bacterium]|nr:50S ribosomal protein L35 [Oscillospiraceae bacterium]MBR3839237.1 50S ribosomal protein L35 [Clostridia bacterium]